MELFLLYAMGLTIVAFFSIVMASPKVLPMAQHGSDNEAAVLKPNQANNLYNESEQESVPTASESAIDPSPSASAEEDSQTI